VHIPATRKPDRAPTASSANATYDVIDLFVTLTAAAGATKRLKLATGICPVIRHNPEAAHRRADAVLKAIVVAGSRPDAGGGRTAARRRCPSSLLTPRWSKTGKRRGD
jgi:hypothetical protein